NVAFNAVTGEYAFSPASSTREDLLWPSAIQLFPNPASEFVNVNIDSDKLANNIQMSVYDNFGRQVMRQTFDSKANIRLNVASLPAGMYTLSITDGKYIVGKQLVVTR
ncbi:MAG TPA: T9SS type A sorting domain-containing protein, partial [Saprospiraceae bacterium]|nr:T9SS type A sorting domain-containing protein [Saprospiraceae bacterium]